MLQYKSGDLVIIISSEKFDFLSPNAEPIISKRKNQFNLEMANNLCGKEVEIQKVYPQFYFIKNWPYKIDGEFIDEEETLRKHPEYSNRVIADKVVEKPVAKITSIPGKKSPESIKLEAKHDYGKGSVIVTITESQFDELVLKHLNTDELKKVDRKVLESKLTIEKKIVNFYYKVKNHDTKIYDCIIDHEATEKLGKVKQAMKRVRKPNTSKIRANKNGGTTITTVRKLKVGELVIGWNKEDKSDFIIGCFRSHDDKGVFKIDDNGKIVTCSHCQLFTDERAVEFAKAKHKATNPVTKEFNELYVKIGEMVGEFSSKYEVEVEFNMKIKDGN